MYYLTNVKGGLSTPDDIVMLVSPTDSTFGDNARMNSLDSDYDNDGRAFLLQASGQSLTIGGNQQPYYNIYYQTTDVNTQNAAVKYSSDGILNFSAQVGGYDSQSMPFVDSAITMYSAGTSNTATQIKQSGSRILDLSCFQASNLTVSSDMSAALRTSLALTSTDYDVNGTLTASSGGNSSVAAGFRVSNFFLTYSFNGSITATNTYDFRTKVTPSVSGNNISSVGVLSNEAVNISGYLDGAIDVSVDGTTLQRNLMQAKYDTTKTGASASISNNNISAYALKSNTLTINLDSNATWTCSMDYLSMDAESSPDTYVTFSGNTLDVAGYKGGSLNISGRLNTTIYSTMNNLNIKLYGYKNSGNVIFQVINNNNFIVSGIYLSGNLTAGDNIATNIKVEAKSGLFTVNAYDDTKVYPMTSIYELYGIKANSISVNGQFSTGSVINVDSSMSSYSEKSKETIGEFFAFSTRTFGIYTESMTAQNYAGTISVNSNFYSCGIYTETTLTSSGSEPFNFNGNISVTSGYTASGMMGFYSGYNLRVSGTISSVSSITSKSDAITSGKYLIDGTHVYSSVNDYIELSASAVITGNINLSAGTNTFMIDSNATVNGIIESDGGLSNIQFNLTGAAKATPTVTTAIGSDLDAFAISPTKIAINLNDAVAGETYYLVDSANVDAKKWGAREFTLTYQGVSQRVKFGDTFYFNTISSYNVSAQVILDPIYGYLSVKILSQESEYALKTVSVSADTSKARSVSLSWDKVTGADYYIVEYAFNSAPGDFSQSISKIVTGNSLNLTQLDGDIQYRVRAASDRGLIGAWDSGSATPGAVIHETPQAPTSMLFINPDQPTQGINTAAVKFEWQDQSDIRYYTLEYIITSDKIVLPPDATPEDYWNAALSTGTMYSRQTNASDFLLTGLPEQSMVYWRINSTGNNGLTSDYTYGNEFQSWTADKTPPQTGKGFTITARTTYDSVTNYETLKFSWGDIVDTQSGISSYIIVCTGANGYTKTYTIRETDPSHPKISSLTVDDFVNANLSNSLRDGTYTYTFQAIDWVGNRTNLISGSNSFTVTPTISTPKATLFTDVNGSTSAKFDWRASGDVTSYTLQYVLADTADFTSPATVTVSFSDMSIWNGGNPTFTVNNLASTADNTSYFWRVQATYSDGTNSGWQSGNSFYFDNTAPDAVTGTHAIVDIKYKTTSNTNNWGAVTNTSVKTSVNAYLSWNSVTDDRGSVHYIVEVADNQYFNNSKIFGATDADEITTNSLTFGDGTNGTIGAGYLSGMQNVYWRVYATDDNGNTSDPTNGIYYQVINPYVGNVTLAPYFKWADVDTTAPTKVTIANQSYSSNDQYFSWSTSTSLEGIAGYNVVFTDKQGNVMYQTYTTNTNVVFDTDSGLADGNYKLSVQAVGCSGRTATATTKSVYIDFNGPTPVGNTSATVFNKDVSLTWTEATDPFGIAAYQIQYTSGNDINSSAITTLTGTKLSLTNLANGKYSYQVRAIDKNGNLGQWTSGEFKIDTAEIAGQTFSTAKTMTWAQSSDQSFGGSWPANYFKYTTTDTGVFTFKIDNMAYGNGKFSVYDSNYKLIKTYSVAQGGSYSYLFNLTAGDYYVMMGSAANYNYGKYTINSVNEYGVSDWSYATKNSGGENYITGSVSDGVLGYGTPTNTFTFNLLYNGEINLSVNNVTGGTVSLTLYQTVNGVDKKLKTLSVSPKNINAALNGLDLYAGGYKIVLSNSQAAQNVTAEYDLSIGGTYFPADTESLVLTDQGDGTVKGTITDAFVGFGDPSDSFTFTASSQAEYNFALSGLSAKATMTIYQTVNGKQVKVTSVNANSSANGYFDTLLNGGDYTVVINNPNAAKTNTLFDLTVQSENNQLSYSAPGDGNANGWLNAANSADYYDFTMYSAGKITLSLDNVTASTKLSIIDSNTNKVVATISTSSLISKDFNLAAGDYWLKVESTKTTAYDFNVLVA